VYFRYSEEQEALRTAVRRLLSEVAPERVVREVMATDAGWDRGAHTRLAQELGAVGLAVPEELGGSGGGIVELGLVLQEAGRSLLPGPLLSCALAAQAILATGSTEHLAEIAAGGTIATVALLEGVSRDAPVRTTATRDGQGWVLDGAKDWVLDAAAADLLVVSAQTPDGLSLFLVETPADGVAVTPVSGVDPTRRQARVVLSGAPAVPLGELGSGAGALAQLLDLAVVLLAAEQLGVAELCLEMATAYAKERTQFDRAIGSFQAVKHKLANVLLEVEAARSAVMYALWAADERPEELPVVACIAGSTCSETALLAASENIQVHGGIGCTWEHPAHLYLKRATTDRLLLGDPQRHLERLATHLDTMPAGHLVEVAR
jgi:alkylation response protein AidB-like acyl-CoA dehydrogenase